MCVCLFVGDLLRCPVKRRIYFLPDFLMPPPTVSMSTVCCFDSKDEKEKVMKELVDVTILRMMIPCQPGKRVAQSMKSIDNTETQWEIHIPRGPLPAAFSFNAFNAACCSFCLAWKAISSYKHMKWWCEHLLICCVCWQERYVCPYPQYVSQRRVGVCACMWVCSRSCASSAICVSHGSKGRSSELLQA